MGARLYISSSKSSSNPTTNNADGRVVGGDESTNSSTVIQGSNNVVSDHGAISSAVELAKAGIEGANKTSAALVASSSSVYEGALNLVGKQQADFTNTLENIKTSDVRTLVIAGMAVVGLVGVMLVKGKG
jgi:hypothetical protein